MGLERWWQDVPGGRWGALRGLLIASALLAHCTYAIPFPRGPTEQDLEEGDWRSTDLEMWHQWTSPIVPLDRQTFDTIVVGAFRALYVTGGWVRKPAKPLFSATKTNQQWGLFAVVTRSPDALVVEIREGKEWRIVEQRLHPDAGWHDEQFKYRRLRGIWDVRKEPKGHYKNFTQWVARMAFADFPEANRVKVYLLRRYVSSPWDPDEEEEPEVKWMRSHKRENHAP